MMVFRSNEIKEKCLCEVQITWGNSRQDFVLKLVKLLTDKYVMKQFD